MITPYRSKFQEMLKKDFIEMIYEGINSIHLDYGHNIASSCTLYVVPREFSSKINLLQIRNLTSFSRYAFLRSLKINKSKLT